MTPPRPRGGALRLLAAGLALAAVTVLAGCSGDPFAEEVASDPGQGVTAENGSWSEIPADARKEAVVFSGVSETGETISSETLAGGVTVVNFWYAACPPCRLEAPDLESMWQQYGPEGVAFVGVNIYDQVPTVESFNESFGITYPSILDVEKAEVRLAFAGNVPPQAIPATLVLDREGRVAATVLGPIDPAILGPMIDRVVAEEAA